MSSLSKFFNNITANAVYDPSASLKTSLANSKNKMLQTIFNPPAPNMSYSTMNGAAPSPSNPIVTQNIATTPTAPKTAATGTKVPPPKATGSSTPASSSGPVQADIPQAWINPAGGFYTPDQIAANIAQTVTKNGGVAANGDIPKYAGDQYSNTPQTTEQLMADTSNLNNARNDISTGTTDPYNAASQSGIPYTPEELSAIEKAYAGVYDPAINTAMAKLKTQQDKEAKDAAFQQDLQKLALQHGYDLETAAYKAGLSNSTGAQDAATTLIPYTKTTNDGTQYADLSSLTPTDKAKYAQLAVQAGIKPILDANTASKLSFIDVSKNNLKNIEDSLSSQKLLNDTTFPPLQGAENAFKATFGNKDIKSFSAWRTAIINNVQALAGGQGSGLRINQAEIDSALKNDLPVLTGPNADNLSTAKAKIEKLNQQLDEWTNEILQGQKKNAPAGTSSDSSTANSSVANVDQNWLNNYDYQGDITAAKDAIAAGADPTAVRNRLLLKYKEVDL